MKPYFYLCLGLSFACCNAADVRVKTATATGGSAQGGSATGGSVTGGSVTGGSATGGSATGGSATGGTVTSGSAAGGSATGGTATPGTVGAGTATAYADGREIRVSAAGSTSVNVNGPDAAITIGGQSLTMTKTKLLLEGQPLAELPITTKKIELYLDDTDMLTVKGDGKEVTRVKMTRK